MARRFVLPARTPEASAASGALRADLQIDYAAELNPQQLAAATASGGPTLIVAGAGTGKTRTLVYRVAYLVETGVEPDRIALLTFTRRAAREMLVRASGLLDGRCERVRGGTFHAFCVEVLRQHGEAIGLPRRFTILDQADAADVIDLVRTEKGLDSRERRFPKKRSLQRILSSAANRGMSVQEVIEEEHPHYARHADAIAELGDAFQATKRRYGLADYDDLLGLTAQLLATQEAIRKQVSGRLTHVLVDEYQDVNHVQADLVRLLASEHGNVTVVGDDAQSIYRFRGADVGHILAFPERFPGARVLKLEENYRSTQPILTLANHVLEGAREKYEKRLFTRKEGGETPGLVPCPDEEWQSRFVCELVLGTREAGVPLARQAVLFRASWCSYALEAELTRRQIPFVKVGGLKLAEAAHVKDMVAHLRVAENAADAVAWNRALLLLEGVGPRTVRKVLDWIGAQEASGADAYGLAFGADARYADSVRALAALLADLRDGRPLADQVDRLLAYYRPHFERIYDDWGRREPDLDGLADLAARYETRADLLESFALDPVDLSQEDVEGAYRDEPPLVLSTIHSAKGLEFDTVVLIDALDGVLPNEYAVKTQAELDEERRLLYVALTRAERELYVSYPASRWRRGSGGFLTRVSRFLEDTPEALLERVALVEETSGSALPPADARGAIGAGGGKGGETPKRLGP
ncbi:ATP-dependent helicase [Rubricoccus marinus]|uniref:DNA 3'-5' helicase n=1 Tax=Rubricoccus marinus TaxID=716817 RepID=A0A259U082_9BACT|nr:ATP-dependent helicase [Rubricoccus marinus]OZC03360.1 ATP-dependent DNA helicase [Rubricoccus marinus]